MKVRADHFQLMVPVAADVLFTGYPVVALYGPHLIELAPFSPYTTRADLTRLARTRYANDPVKFLAACTRAGDVIRIERI